MRRWTVLYAGTVWGPFDTHAEAVTWACTYLTVNARFVVAWINEVER